MGPVQGQHTLSTREKGSSMGSVTVANKKPHAVCIPLPFQGHINAMLKLAKLLYFKGFYVTFVNTEFNHQKLLKSRGPDSLQALPDFRFETIPDGLPPCDINAAQDIMALCESLKTNILGSIRGHITKINQNSVFTASPPRVTCIVTDGAMTPPLDAAEEFGIPGVLLWPMSASFLTSYLHCQHLVEKGIIPVKDKSALENGYLDMPIDCIPGLRDIRLKDLPSCFWEDDNPMDNFLIAQLPQFSKASAIVINTFEALESEVLEPMKSLLPPLYTVGPLQLIHLQEMSSSNKLLNSLGSNLWKENEECLRWLDSKQPNSVIYVNFGSITSLSPQQFIEFAWGIANSKQPFLWVIRHDLVSGEAAVFPPEFVEETADRGMISGWCPQERVLYHSSVGGFLTHSGWNSTMDTFSGGVPIISWPFFADQQNNCRCACVHWGIGMELDKEVRRDAVEGLVRELMEGEKGKNMKKKSMEWKKIAEESTKPGGTSYEDLDRVAKVLMQNALD